MTDRFDHSGFERVDAMWIAILAAAAMAFGIAMAGCGHVPPMPDGALDLSLRLYCVEHGHDGRCQVYRSAQPTAEQFKALVAKYGIRSVIKLNTALPFDGGHDVLPAGVELYDHPWAPAGLVSHEDVAEALQDLDDADKPALVHCAHGEDRTGLLVGLYRVRHHVAPFAAWGEMRAFGFHEDLVGLKWSWERETGYAP